MNLAVERAFVEYDPADAGPGALIRAVEDAGYGVERRKSGFGVTGMSCASCVGSVERALRGIPGVLDANVNLAAERATVEYLAGSAEVRDFEQAVEGAGYGVVREEEGTVEDVRGGEYGRFKRRFFVAAALTALVLIGSLPMMVGTMVPIPVRWLDFVLFALATPVQFWAGWRFYRGAWGGLRHGQANMNTLVAVGTSAAYLYSAAATLAPWIFGGRADVYFDTSSFIVTLILLGRLLEARARAHRRGPEKARRVAGEDGSHRTGRQGGGCSDRGGRGWG